MKTVFCLAEDRGGTEVGLKLVVLGLARHCPGSRVVIFREKSAPGFEEWLGKFPEVRLEKRRLEGANSWNCKPQALLALMGSAADTDTQWVWLDSDLLITADVREVLSGVAPGTLVLTQEPQSAADQGSRIRTEGWGLPVGREHPCTFNSCLVRVTAGHRRLLERWQELLADERYVAASRLGLKEKPVHLWSDQDVLNAVLGSAEFAGLEVRMLRHGLEVLHTGGALAFTLGERTACLFRREPVLLHAIGIKPWVLLRMEHREPGSFAWLRRLLQETSPYVHHARRYRGQLEEPVDWFDYRTLTGLVLNAVAFGHWALRGLPVAVACRVARSLRLM